MVVLALIVANLRRRVARTALTAAGIAVGVAAIVALLALSAGLNRSAGQLVHLGRADLGLFQQGASDPTASVLPLSLIPRLRAEAEIADATPLQLVVGGVARAPGAVVFGLDPRGFVARSLIVTAGRARLDGGVLVGDLLAGSLHLVPGGELELKGRAFRVTGVYHSGVSFEDGGAAVALPTAQSLAGRSPDEATTIAVRVKPGVSSAAETRRLSRRFPGLTVIADASEAIRAGANGQLIAKAVLLIVALALIIGALAVANSMLTAVLERRRELVLLATVGWSTRQLGGLVLGEAVGVSMIGTACGLVLGLVASELLPRALGLRQFVSPELTAWGLGRGALIGVTIGVVGAVYPVWRVTRLRPTVALGRP